MNCSRNSISGPYSFRREKTISKYPVSSSSDLMCDSHFIGSAEGSFTRCIATAVSAAYAENPPAISRDANDDYLVILARQVGVTLVSGDPDLTVPGLALTPREFLEGLLTSG